MVIAAVRREWHRRRAVCFSESRKAQAQDATSLTVNFDIRHRDEELLSLAPTVGIDRLEDLVERARNDAAQDRVGADALLQTAPAAADRKEQR